MSSMFSSKSTCRVLIDRLKVLDRQRSRKNFKTGELQDEADMLQYVNNWKDAELALNEATGSGFLGDIKFRRERQKIDNQTLEAERQVILNRYLQAEEKD